MIRLEHGDLLPDCLEQFAAENKIEVGLVHLIGGLHQGRMVVGPHNESVDLVKPKLKDIDAQPGETISFGVIAPDKHGKPVAHIHGALGRGEETTVGCLRPGIKTWLMGEVIIQEIVGTASKRILNNKTKLNFLEP